MSLAWIPENPSHWNPTKRALITAPNPGLFPDLEALDGGRILPGSWWRVERDGEVVGYGWMDVTWGYAPVLLAVSPDARGDGLGAWIFDHLAEEARAQGIEYLFNVIPTGHPDPKGLASWLRLQGFEPASGDRTMLRRKV